MEEYDVCEVVGQSPNRISDGALSSLGVHHFGKKILAGEKVGITFVLGNGITFTAVFLVLEIREATKEGGNETLLLYNLGEQIVLK